MGRLPIKYGAYANAGEKRNSRYKVGVFTSQFQLWSHLTTLIDLRNSLGSPHLQYEGGAWAIDYLSHLTGSNKAAFVDYYINLAESERSASQNGKAGTGWKKSFKEAFGMSVETFYQKFDDFMTWSESKQMAILMKPGKM